MAMAGVILERYAFAPFAKSDTHPFARRFDVECRRAEQVLYAATRVASTGFVPDVVVVHCGWGENLPLGTVFPRAKIVVYCEFYYRAEGQDLHFDPENPRLGIDGVVALDAKNAATLLAMADADLWISPTEWQRSTYPRRCQSGIEVVHEGVDVDHVRPKAEAILSLPSGRVFQPSDEILTYVARDLEPLRGFRTLMRALPAIQSARPRVQTVIIGGDSVSYGLTPSDGRSWKDNMLRELGGSLDLDRIHFLGRVPFATYLAALQVSTVHVYLTYPFVLSWSFLEAMAAGCRIVASDTSPVQEVMGSTNGILVPFFDIERLALEVSKVLASPAQFSGLGANARETVSTRFNSADCTFRWRQLLEALTAAG